MTDYLSHTEYDFTDPLIAGALDEVSIWGARFGLLLLELIDLRPGIEALDLGCGTGFPLIELAQMHGPTCRFTGLDPWGAALERARAKIAAFEIPHISVVQLEGERFPFSDGAFDLITGNLVLNNLEHPAITLAECARVARAGARIVMTTNLAGHMGAFYAVFRAVLQESGDPAALARLEAHIAHRGTRESQRALIEAAGFRITREVARSTDYRNVDGSAFLRHAFVRYAFMPAWRTAAAGLDESALFEEIEARLNAQARAQGGLALAIPMLYLEGERDA